MIFTKLQCVLMITTVTLALVSVRRAGWLDRVVEYHKKNFIKDVEKNTPVKINAEIKRKPPGYVDSLHWDYDSVIRLLTLLRQSEKARPVHKALRRMLQPTRRLMMSIKDSLQRFPSLSKHEKHSFYYDVDYTEEEQEDSPLPEEIPEDEVVVMVSNAVEARLPSARISVKLLREILEARARAARAMPTTEGSSIPWKAMAKTEKLPGRDVHGGGGVDCGEGGEGTEGAEGTNGTDGTTEEDAGAESTSEGDPEAATEGASETDTEPATEGSPEETTPET